MESACSGGVTAMEKILLCNLDLLRKNDYASNNDFISRLDLFLDNKNNDVIFFSRNVAEVEKAKEFYENKGKRYYFFSRNQVNQLVDQNRNDTSEFVVVGSKNIDFQLAVNNQLLLLSPKWIQCEEKAERYGILINTTRQLFQIADALNNYNSWYTYCQIDDHTTVFSLMDARYKYYSKSDDERIMVQKFERLLKSGRERDYYHILLYHFVASMTNTNFFDDIELFGMIPSSDCSLNEDMFRFMQQVRYIKKKRLPHNNMRDENLLIRRYPKDKAHEARREDRLYYGPEIEFSTLCINSEFEDKIYKLKDSQRLKVCIFDDYMTHGNSFNAVRNLFNHLQADKVVCVSLGYFGNPFEKWDYDIKGDVFNVGYEYELIQKNRIIPI